MATSYFPPVMFNVAVDLSHWNRIVDPVASFQQAYGYGVTQVFLKTTQGTSYVDPTYAGRRTAAVSAGLGVAAYCFVNAEPPVAQVDWLFKSMGSFKQDLEIMLDAERNTAGDGNATVQILETMAQEIHKRVGFWPILYMGRRGPDGLGTALPSPVLSKCPLFLPQWGQMPSCPPGWTAWKLWQYTNGKIGIHSEPVPGIGQCDRSMIAANSLQELAAWWGKRQEP